MQTLLVSGGVHISEAERKRHLVTIDWLAEKSGVPRQEIDKLYEAELERVMSARIREFLPILIVRKVKLDLLNRQAS